MVVFITYVHCYWYIDKKIDNLHTYLQSQMELFHCQIDQLVCLPWNLFHMEGNCTSQVCPSCCCCCLYPWSNLQTLSLLELKHLVEVPPHPSLFSNYKQVTVTIWNSGAQITSLWFLLVLELHASAPLLCSSRIEVRMLHPICLVQLQLVLLLVLSHLLLPRNDFMISSNFWLYGFVYIEFTIYKYSNKIGLKAYSFKFNHKHIYLLRAWFYTLTYSVILTF